MAINDVVQARIIGRLHGQTTINTLCYILRDALTTPSDIANDVAGNIVSFILQAASVDLIIDRVDCQTIDPMPRTFVVSVNVNSTGTLAGQAVPSSVAVVIRKRTALAGRKYRGRCYFPGAPDQQTLNSQLSAAQVTAWEKVATAMIQGAGGIGQIPATPCLFAPRKGYLPQPLPLTTCVVDPILRNQRRRQVGIGI